jgi:hypothetical protein
LKNTSFATIIHVHIGSRVSPRSVAGAGVTESEDISANTQAVAKFLAPIMGAVVAGLDITQATASVEGFIPCSASYLLNRSATTKFISSP